MEKVTEVTLMNVLDKDLMCFKHFSNLAWEGVSKIGDYAFTNAKKIEEINIPEGITSIGTYAFLDCADLREARLPESVQKIKRYAFAGCKKLRKITVKTKTLRMVGKNALRGISSRAVVKVPKKSLKRYQKLFRNKGQRRTVVIR